jgi:hypothetical protein
MHTIRNYELLNVVTKLTTKQFFRVSEMRHLFSHLTSILFNIVVQLHPKCLMLISRTLKNIFKVFNEFPKCDMLLQWIKHT